MSYSVERSDIQYFALGANFLHETSLWQDFCSPLGRAAIYNSIFRGSNKYESPYTSTTEAQLRQTFSPRPQQEYLETALLETPPPDSIAEQRGDMSWGKWLSRSASQGGMRASTYRDLLAWNLDEMQTLNETAAPYIAQAVEDYSGKLERHLDSGNIAPSFVEAWNNRKQQLKVVIAGPLDSMNGLDGQCFSKDTVVMLAASHARNAETQTHEFTHIAGGFSNRLLNEATTTMLEKQITPSGDTTSYVFTRHVLESLMQEAGVSMAAVSDCYAGKRRRNNYRQLRRLASASERLQRLTRVADQVFELACRVFDEDVNFHRESGLYIAGALGFGEPDKLLKQHYGDFASDGVLSSLTKRVAPHLAKLDEAVQRAGGLKITV